MLRDALKDLCLLSCLCLAACTATVSPLPAPGLGPTPTAAPAPTGPPPTPVCEDEASALPHYDLRLSLDYAAHTAEVAQSIQVANTSGAAWPDLALAVAANDSPGVFSLHSLSVDGFPGRYVLDGVGLRVLLAAPLDSGCRLTVHLEYSLALPRLDSSAFGWRGALGWTPRQVLLGGWYPTLVPYRAGAGWLARRPAPQGEFETVEASDVAVRLELVGEAAEVQVVGSAAPGACPDEDPPPETVTCYALPAARHFAFALSDQMRVLTDKTGQTTITSMYFPEHVAGGRQVLETARDAFAVYGNRYGPAPYTWLAGVEADMPDGMEFSGLFLLGRPYYAEFDRTPQNYLTVIAAHETAHQWWYSLVGNDPAAEPWLDESLATYSEEVYFEAAFPELVEWWWQFRVWFYLPVGPVDSDIYTSDEFRPYVDAVYLNGAQFLHALRGEAGDETFFNFLRAYAERGAGRIMTAEDFWEIYGEFGDAEGSEARRTYFEGSER